MTAVAGGSDILMAYQPVGPNIDRLLNLVGKYPQSRFSTIVDCLEIAHQLSAAASRIGVQVDVYLDLNVGMNRTGISVGSEATKVYRFLHESPGLRAAGIHAYDGHIHVCELEKVQRMMDQAFNPCLELDRRNRAVGNVCS